MKDSQSCEIFADRLKDIRISKNCFRAEDAASIWKTAEARQLRPAYYRAVTIPSLRLLAEHAAPVYRSSPELFDEYQSAEIIVKNIIKILEAVAKSGAPLEPAVCCNMVELLEDSFQDAIARVAAGRLLPRQLYL